jgi:hypothetical protein
MTRSSSREQCPSKSVRISPALCCARHATSPQLHAETRPVMQTQLMPAALGRTTLLFRERSSREAAQKPLVQRFNAIVVFTNALSIFNGCCFCAVIISSYLTRRQAMMLVRLGARDNLLLRGSCTKGLRMYNFPRDWSVSRRQNASSPFPVDP